MLKRQCSKENIKNKGKEKKAVFNACYFILGHFVVFESFAYLA